MRKIVFIVAFIVLTGAGCRKLLAPDPLIGNIPEPEILKNESDALGYLANAYAHLRNNYWQYIAIPLMLYGDELRPLSGSKLYLSYAEGWVEPDNRINLNCWKSLYSLIYYCNWWIEKSQGVEAIPKNIRDQISGEFYFLRAFAYLHLIQIYGPVPLVTESDVNKNIGKARSPVSEVLKLIVQDLWHSTALLSKGLVDENSFRPSQYAVLLLQARTAMFSGDWQRAVELATQILDSGHYELDGIPNLFQLGSRETIWQWWNGTGIHDKANLILPVASSTPDYILSQHIDTLFEPNDLRRHHWTRSFRMGDSLYSYPVKYKNSGRPSGSSKEYRVEMRLAEVYLIRAEALLRLRNTNQAITSINALRLRAGLLPLSASVPIDSAWHYWWLESQREFFTEGCHRFLNLKRHDLLKEKLARSKPAWREGGDLLPIPTQEIHLNPALTQNAGY
jgi:hypothetical protein